MSSSYWQSSHRNKWSFTRQELLQFRSSLYLQNQNNPNGSPLKYDFNLRIYLHKLVIKLAKKLNLRQIIISTSEVYLNRFLTKVSIHEVNLYLLVTTCIYLACKIEENPQHIRTILNEARAFWPEFIPNDLTKIAELEFYLIEELDCYLVIFHPYNTLIDVFTVLNKSFKLDLNQLDLQNSWSIINDSYITDLHLLFPPHIIAISSIYLSIVLSDNSLSHSQTLLQAQSNSQSQSSQSQNQSAQGQSLTPQQKIQQASNGRSLQHLSNHLPIQSSLSGQNNTQPNQLSNLNPNNTNSGGNGGNSANANSTGSNSTPGDGNNGNGNNNGNNHNGSGNSNTNGSNSVDRINTLIEFLSVSNIQLNELIESVQEILTLYEIWNSYDEHQIRNALHGFLLKV